MRAMTRRPRDRLLGRRMDACARCGDAAGLVLGRLLGRDPIRRCGPSRRARARTALGGDRRRTHLPPLGMGCLERESTHRVLRRSSATRARSPPSRRWPEPRRRHSPPSGGGLPPRASPTAARAGPRPRSCAGRASCATRASCSARRTTPGFARAWTAPAGPARARRGSAPSCATTGPSTSSVSRRPAAARASGLVVPTLLTWPHSVLVYDIKKENWALTAGWRRQFSRTWRFEPTAIDSVRFNPLFEIRKGLCEVRDTQNIADILVDPTGDKDTRDHWQTTAHSLLCGAILHVLYAEADKTLAGVAAVLSDPGATQTQTLKRMIATRHLAERPPPARRAGGARDAQQERQRAVGRLLDGDVVPGPVPRSGRRAKHGARATSASPTS